MFVSSLRQRMREEMEEITQQQLVHDKYCKELMGFGTKPRHITPFTSFQSLQPQQSNALLGLLGYSTPQGFLTFGAAPAPAKTSLVESRYCRELMEERFDQVGFSDDSQLSCLSHIKLLLATCPPSLCYWQATLLCYYYPHHTHHMWAASWFILL